jgi:hypothetical protein
LIKKKSDVSNNVTLEQFVEYFKTLNELPENEKGQEIDFDSVVTENVHNIFNSPITEEEITVHWTTYLVTCIDVYIYIYMSLGKKIVLHIC